jgi:GH15 family glucan-1,4-alpha-glucosidase
MPDLYQRSIEIIKQHQASTGAYVASPNFPNYGYSWLRDSSYIAHAMSLAGEHDSVEAYLGWVNRILQRFSGKVGVLIARLSSNQTPGSDEFLHTRYTLTGEEVPGDPGDDKWGNFQMDGYGTWLWMLSEHIQLSGNITLIREFSDSILTALEYLLAVWHLPNYDCWEEFPEYCHPYSIAAVYGGFQASLQLATLGLEKLPVEKLQHACAEIQAFVRQTALVDGALVKLIEPARPGKPAGPVIDSRVDANLIGLTTPNRLFAPDDPIWQKTLQHIEQDIVSQHGGVYRYRNDTYFGGGEWLVLSAWLGWHYCETGQRKRAEYHLNWVEANAHPNGEMPEQVNDHALFPDYFPFWVKKWGPVATPLLWSQAMYMILRHKLNAMPPTRTD